MALFSALGYRTGYPAFIGHYMMVATNGNDPKLVKIQTELEYRNNCSVLTEVSPPVKAISSCSSTVSYFIGFQNFISLISVRSSMNVLWGNCMMA